MEELEIQDRPEHPLVIKAKRLWTRITRIPHISTIALSAAVMIVALMAGGLLLHNQLRARAAANDPAALTANTDGSQSVAAQLTPDAFTLSPDAVRDLTPDGARAFNAELPFATGPLQAAKPFVMSTDDLVHYTRALDCMTAAIYFEAANETLDGQRAVAQVIINRSRHPAYPRTICGVVFQGSERTTGCQFTFTCDGALGRKPSAAGWARSRAVASAALNGAVAAHVGMATHYHTDWVAPYWAPRLTKLVQIGTHIFYRWPGAWGLSPAFTGRHPGSEPEMVKMGALATNITLDPLATSLDDPSLALTDLPAPAASLLPSPLPAEPAEDDEPAQPATAPAPAPQPAPAPVRAAPAPVLPANPLQPAQPQPARRPRLPTPGGW